MMSCFSVPRGVIGNGLCGKLMEGMAKMVDFSKHKNGVVNIHCCDRCSRSAGWIPKVPADSGVESWFCDVCGHYGIGSLTPCEIVDGLRLRPLS
jgi:hypothetical protein